MAKLILDMSGRGGLLERYQGDLNDTSSSPHLRYLGGDNQYAEGQFNPFSHYGYMSPPNNTFTSLTGTVASNIVSFAYDGDSTTLFIAEEGSNILQLSDLEDTSVANYLTISTGTLKDAVVYEVAGRKALVYVTDSGSPTKELTEGSTSAPTNQYNTPEGGMYTGFKMLDSTKDDYAIEAEYSFPPAVSGTAIAATAQVIDDGTNHSTKLAQPFNTDLIPSKTINSVGLKLMRFSGTGAGITMKVSIQAEADKNTAPYTYQGGWALSTAYVENDTVENNGVTFVCIDSHTSASTNEPEVGSATEDFWQRFAAPDGTDIASVTLAATEITDDSVVVPTGFFGTSNANVLAADRTWFDFASPVSLTPNTNYWVVLEEDGSSMTSGDEIGWFSTINDNAYYAPDVTNGVYAKCFTDNLVNPAFPVWMNNNQNDQGEAESRDFQFGHNRFDTWSRDLANGRFSVDTGIDTFLYLADNGLLYWFTGNQVHSIDGSETGGTPGTVNNSILLFPSYTSIPDVAETRGRMYIGVQTSERTTDTDTFFGAHRAGVYVWDRRSQIIGGSDFFPAPGAREIRNIFTSSTGDVLAITINNSGFSELRALSGNQFAVIQTMEKEAYPQSRRGISQVGNMSIWLGRNGIFYAYGSVVPGEPLKLYKIGDTSGQTNFDVPGAIFTGNKDSSNNELAVYFGWSDTGPGYNISKWYPNGTGTIDSNAQKAGQGDTYTKVQQLPGLSTVQYIRGFHMPGGTDGDATVAATLKCYKNQSSTPEWSLPITYDDLNKGWFEKEWNQPNINFLQFEVEWNTTPTLGSNTYRPMYLEIETQDEGRINT